MMNRFHFRGFQPTQELEKHADEVLSELSAEAPTDASFLGSVEVSPDGYVARLDVYSKHGPFLADSLALTPQSALDEVIERIRFLLDQWKERKAMQERYSFRRDPYTTAPDALP